MTRRRLTARRQYVDRGGPAAACTSGAFASACSALTSSAALSAGSAMTKLLEAAHILPDGHPLW